MDTVFYHNAALSIGEAGNPKGYSKSDQRPDDKPASEAHKTLKIAA